MHQMGRGSRSFLGRCPIRYVYDICKHDASSEGEFLGPGFLDLLSDGFLVRTLDHALSPWCRLGSSASSLTRFTVGTRHLAATEYEVVEQEHIVALREGSQLECLVVPFTLLSCDFDGHQSFSH